MTYRPVEPTRRRLRHLLAGGASMAGIAGTIGVSPATLVNIDRRHNRWVQSWTAEALERLSVPETIPHERTGYPAVGAHRRITALLAIGWTHAHLSMQAGVSTSETIAHAVRRVDTRTYRGVRSVYDELAMTPGPSNRNRLRAERFGWVPPLAWDEHSIDDPDAEPATAEHGHGGRGGNDDVDPVSVDLAVGGEGVTLTRAERIEVVRRLAARGYSDAKVAVLVGTSSRTVLRDRAGHGIPSRLEAGSGRLVA